MSDNQYFRLDVINENGTVMNEDEIGANLTSIIENSSESNSSEKFHPIGVLTTDERDVWYKNRSHLESTEKNRKTLSVIDNALFILVLESTQPSTITESSKLIFHGNGQNRWFDKLQVIVCKNGRAGLNMEHSGYDGHTLLQYASYVYSDHVTKLVKQMTKPLPSYSTNLRKITHSKLGWDIDEQTKTEINETIKRFDAFTGMTSTFVLKFEKYGKIWITRNKMSPDAFVQMVYQLTWFRMFGKIAQTYESVNTKQFLHGRTETGRPATVESAIFTKMMGDETVDAETKINALRKACVAHVEELRQCKNGFGVDRHFFALQGIAKSEMKKNPNFKMPSLYTDPSYAVLKTDLMSTSNCGDDEALDVFGFGPTSEKGFGIGYVVKDNAMIFNITSFEGKAEEYSKMLNKTFLDLRDMVESI
jgi:carnitine O-acetyltransferase